MSMLLNWQERAKGEEMTTLCNNCGSALETDINFCPNCGTPTSSYYSHSGSSEGNPTAIPGSADAVNQKASTGYGSLPGRIPDENPYSQFNPYGIVPPRALRPVRSNIIIAIISSITVSILIFGVVGTFVFLLFKGSNTSTKQPFTPVSTAAHSQQPSPGCGGAFSDEFNGSLNSQWKWVNPSGSAEHGIMSQGPLRISAPDNNDLYPTSNYNAPRLLQSVSGNFTIETSVEFSPRYFFQGAGILVWQDEGNFLRLERSYVNSGGIGFHKVEKGTWSDIAPSAFHLTEATRVELRIQRNGDHLTASWREPDQEWQFDGETTIHFDNLMVGLLLVSQHQQHQTTAYYDYFRISCA